jgi:hypothetical protein
VRELRYSTNWKRRTTFFRGKSMAGRINPTTHTSTDEREHERFLRPEHWRHFPDTVPSFKGMSFLMFRLKEYSGVLRTIEFLVGGESQVRCGDQWVHHRVAALTGNPRRHRANCHPVALGMSQTQRPADR